MAGPLRDRAKKALTKKARKGYSGHPLATIAFYGPSDRIASKAVVSVILAHGLPPDPIHKWFSEHDARTDPSVLDAILKFTTEHAVRSIAMPERIIGCPHEEGVDYPLNAVCPSCPFWSNRDRWTGKPFNQDH